MKNINQGYRDIPVRHLIPHPHNPNRGDLDAIGESVDVNGFYGAVTVRDHPSEENRYEILAGEHRWRTAIDRGAATVPCIIVEADDVAAARILLADNETAKRSTYDPDAITQVLRELGSVEGTGFDLAGLAEFEDERAARADEAAAEAGLPEGDDVPFEHFVREYGVVVYCDDEPHQQRVYEELRAAGHRVRVASI